MDLPISTPGLLFPAVSLLFLSYTNRFLHLSALVRTLHKDWQKDMDELLKAQIDNLRSRLKLIRWMQLLGAFSLLLSVLSMISLLADFPDLGVFCFGLALISMAVSLICLAKEIRMSGGALEILLNAMEER